MSLSWSLPCISAIAVQGGNFSHKINCGGPDYKDYAADYLGTTQIAWGAPRGALSADDFYDDWALTMFGTEAAEQIAHLFKKLDGSLPRPAAYHCPCAMLPDNRPWEKVAIEFEFVNELQKFRPKIKGPGNLERFDYWLNTFRYLRGLARAQCELALVNQALEKIDAEKDAAKRKLLAKEHALPLYRNLLKSYGLAYRHLMATVSTKGALVNVINLEQEANFWPIVVDKPAKKIAEAIGEDLPPDAMPAKTYDGPAKIIVPTVRTHLTKGESLNLNIILLSNDSPVKAALYFRTLGADKYEKIELTHLARATYSAAVPAEKIKNNDFEYHIKTTLPGGNQIYFPATAPKMNQTIVVN